MAWIAAASLVLFAGLVQGERELSPRGSELRAALPSDYVLEPLNVPWNTPDAFNVLVNFGGELHELQLHRSSVRAAGFEALTDGGNGLTPIAAPQDVLYAQLVVYDATGNNIVAVSAVSSFTW